MRHAVAKTGFRKGLTNGRDGAFRQLALKLRELTQLFPEPFRFFLHLDDQIEQPIVGYLSEHERRAPGTEPLAVALEDRLAKVGQGRRTVVLAERQSRAGGQPHKIQRVSLRVSLVEIVDAPHKPAFDIAPSAEVVGVKVAHGQHLGRGYKLLTVLRPQLHPAVESRAHELEGAIRHSLMLILNIFLIYRQAPTQPFLIFIR